MKKIILIIIISTFIIFPVFGFLNTAFSANKTVNGYVYSEHFSSKIYTGNYGVLGKSQVLHMVVSKVLDSGFAKEQEEFFAEITRDLVVDKGILIPRGTIAHGHLYKVLKAERGSSNGLLELSFDSLITPDGRVIPIKGRMSTKKNFFLSFSEHVVSNAAYITAGGVAGSLAAIAFLGPDVAALSNGASILGGAAFGGAIGLCMSFDDKEKEAVIAPGDEIKVKLNLKNGCYLPVYKKNAQISSEVLEEGLKVSIKNVEYKKNPLGEASRIILDVSVINNTDIKFSIYDLNLSDFESKEYYPAFFAGDDKPFNYILPGDSIRAKIPYSVDDIKKSLWLTFYDRQCNKIVAKISVNDSYRCISKDTKKKNYQLFTKKNNYFREIMF